MNAAFAALMLVVAPPMLVACATGNYSGISFAPGAADAELQALAQRAQAGDKQAQLDLGIRFEEGRGVPRNLRRAASLYRAAAADRGGTRLAYIPASTRGGRAATVPLNSGPLVPGLAEARTRLAALAASANPPQLSDGGRPIVRFSAVLRAVTQLDTAGFCDTTFARCEVYRFTLSNGRLPPCPLIAINYYDDNGHRYHIWPETMTLERPRRWTFLTERIESPFCFYALINAS